MKGKGYVENTRLGNWKLLIGTAVIAIALLAQFYPKKFPQNREFLLGCIALYPLQRLFSCSDELVLDLILLGIVWNLLFVTVGP